MTACVSRCFLCTVGDGNHLKAFLVVEQALKATPDEFLAVG